MSRVRTSPGGFPGVAPPPCSCGGQPFKKKLVMGEAYYTLVFDDRKLRNELGGDDEDYQEVRNTFSRAALGRVSIAPAPDRPDPDDVGVQLDFNTVLGEMVLHFSSETDRGRTLNKVSFYPLRFEANPHYLELKPSDIIQLSLVNSNLVDPQWLC